MLTHYLEKYFGYTSFLPGQEKVINLICHGKDTLVVMPTGGGKSLCYQLPALLLQGTALVISPLIALMKDQHDALLKRGYPATFLNSSLSREETTERLRATKYNHYKLIYVAPERLNNDYFINMLSGMQISFLAIDEAHCISEWGHDFRPAYLNIVQALKNINISHTVALTATATPDVRKDIINVLKMKEPNVLVEGFDRTNLNYFTEYTTNKNEKMAEILLQHAPPQGSAIIYCGTRKQTEDSYATITKSNIMLTNNITATYYHGGMNDESRQENQDKFINGASNVIVATNAFGMGINKPNVRNVIHINLPNSVEAYYQEAGRAGRDGYPANCYLLYDYSDVKLGQWFIEKNFPKKTDFENVYNYIFTQINANLPLNKQQPIPINSIAVALNMERQTVLQILKHFALQKIIERNNFSTKSKIAFNYSKTEMLTLMEGLPALHRTVFDAIIRSFPNSEQNRYFELDVLGLSQKYNITLQEICNSIDYFTSRQIVAIELAKPANSINVIAERPDFESLNIDFQKQQTRKAWMLEKLRIMQEYAKTEQCKRNFILEYFADNSKQDVCGRCSSCLKINDNGTAWNEDRFEKIGLKVLSGATELNGKFGFKTLAEYLLGLPNSHTKKYELYRGKYFGTLNNVKRSEVNTAIDTLLLHGFLEVTDEQYTLLVATAKGKSYIKEDIKPLLCHKKDFLAQKNKKFLEQMRTKNRPVENVAQVAKSAPTLINKINTLFQNGKTIDAVAKQLDIPKGNVASIIQAAIEQGVITEYWHYADAEMLDEVKLIVLKHPGILLRDVQQKLQKPTDVALLRIILAFARKDLLTING